MELASLIPLVIFGITFFFIFTERINRMIAAVLGGVAMIFSGVLTGQEALASIEFPAIASIIGILLLISVVRSSGFFSYIAIKAVKIVRGNPAKLMVVFSLISAVMASFLGGSATILILGGLIVTIGKQLNLKIKPYLMASALMASIGASFLLTGSTGNILVAKEAGFSFADFLSNTLPIGLIACAINCVVLILYFKIENKPAQTQILLSEKDAIADWKKFYIAAGLLVFTIAAFIFSPALGLTVQMVAVTSGILALLFSGFEPEKAFKEVEWETIFFLAGMFILMRGVEHSGLFHFIATGIAPAVGGQLGAPIFLWASGLMSGIVPSLPLTVALIPIVSEVAKITAQAAGPLFWTLILAVKMGETFTPLGSTSSILAMGIGRHSGDPIGFWEFFKISAICTAISLFVASVWVFIRY